MIDEIYLVRFYFMDLSIILEIRQYSEMLFDVLIANVQITSPYQILFLFPYAINDFLLLGNRRLRKKKRM